MKYIIIGGFMESKFALDGIASEIERLDESAQISTYTFGFAMKHSKQINNVCENAILITHSSGVLVIGRGANPRSAVFIAPSQPIARYRLFIRAARKIFTHSMEFWRAEKRKTVLRILLSNAFECLVHPIRNFKPYVLGEVSNFDIRKHLPREHNVRIVLSEHDEMFLPAENKFEPASSRVEIISLNASHDEIFIDTRKVLQVALDYK